MSEAKRDCIYRRWSVLPPTRKDTDPQVPSEWAEQRQSSASREQGRLEDIVALTLSHVPLPPHLMACLPRPDGEEIFYGGISNDPPGRGWRHDYCALDFDPETLQYAAEWQALRTLDALAFLVQNRRSLPATCDCSTATSAA